MIPQMVSLWREGHDVVYGVRIERRGESRFKLWTAKLFYRLINYLSETKMPLDTGDFRLMDRRVVDVIKMMPERARFLRVHAQAVAAVDRKGHGMHVGSGEFGSGREG